jgi:exosome complex RNA-binding protein Rrp42 (RNase PH superfamily)
VVEKDEEEADIGEVEDYAPLGVFAVLMELEVQNENTHGDEKRQHQASQDDEDILRNTGPWRVTCSEEGRLCLS